MSPAAKSLFAFGCYLLPLGLILLFVPNLLLGLFQIPATTEVWIRIVGMLVFFLSIYYFIAARAELRVLMLWSARLRASVFVFFCVFVLLGLAPVPLILLGAADLAGAAWTWAALRKQPVIA